MILHEIQIVQSATKQFEPKLIASFQVEGEDKGLERLQSIELFSADCYAELTLGNDLARVALYRKCWDKELEKYSVFANTESGEAERI